MGNRFPGTWVLSGWAIAVLMFLYVPIVVVVVYAFNDNRHVTLWTGFTNHWFGDALNDSTYTNAVKVSLKIAVASAILSTTLGSAAALGLARGRRLVRMPFDVLTYLALAVPEIVIAVAGLAYFVQARANDPTGLFPALGWQTVVLGHTIFGTAVVAIVVRARVVGMPAHLEEVGRDLGAGPVATFYYVTLPQLYPAVGAGFLLAFVFSFDDYVMSAFTSGTTQTWPMVIYSSVRFGISPKVNALAAIMLVVTIAAGVVAILIMRASGVRDGRAAAWPGASGSDARPARNGR